MQLKFAEGNDTVDAKTLFADVILPFPLYHPFTYRVPRQLEKEMQAGKRVVVQFGKKKIYTAITFRLHHAPPKEYQAKYILDVIDEKPILFKEHLSFWEWIAAYYCAPIGDVMAAALPANMKLQSESKVSLTENFKPEDHQLSDDEFYVSEALEVEKELTISKIEELLSKKNIYGLIKRMHENGIIEIKEELKHSYRPKQETFVEINKNKNNEEGLKQILDELKRAPKQQDIILAYLALKQTGKHVSKKALLEKAGAGPSALKSLENKGFLTTFSRNVDRLAWEEVEAQDFTLSELQQETLNSINHQFQDKNVVLLHGVTGSGKTNIYLKLLESLLSEDDQALYLVPEISLTAQLVKRLKTFFGNKIGVYHSKFSADERVEIWRKILSKEYKIVLGARSAVFLPFTNLRMVIVDEEHENSFKQIEPSPHYNGRDASIYLANLTGAKVVLGSATPSLESYFNAVHGKYGLVKLRKQYGNFHKPKISVVDLRDAYHKRSIIGHFTHYLVNNIRQILDEKKQAILFQNRRGYSPFIECQVCGWVPQCENCDISLTYHKFFKVMRCHYCGYEKPVPPRCNACGSTDLKMKGFGTEQIEDEVTQLFSDAEVVRMDQDTTRRKKAFQKIIDGFEKGEKNIMVGTQMVTKGLDFENVKLVGILNADNMLKFPDFRAIERSFQLMLQVSGRAGRRQEQGIVVIQTFEPEHPIFKFLINSDYENFFESEIRERQRFHYPPFFRLIKIIGKNKKLETVKRAMEILANHLKKHFGHRVLGPEFPPVMRIRNLYQIHILLKFEKGGINLPNAKETIMDETGRILSHSDFKSMRIIIDVDPM